MSTSNGVGVALLEEREIVRSYLSWLLTRCGLRVRLASGSAASFAAELSGLPQTDVALLVLPDEPAGQQAVWATQVLGEVRSRLPGLPMVVLGHEGDPEVELTCRQMAAGLLGAWTASLEDLVEAIGVATQQGLGAPKPPGVEHLTAREREVLSHVGAGHDNLKIAALLNITEHTVKAHVAAIYRKVQAENRVELALLAARAGLVVRPGRPGPVPESALGG